MIGLCVALGAAIGAPLRYLTDRWVQSRHTTLFPWGTFTVNVAGSFVLGLLAGLPMGAEATALVGTGFCGALTTYSTFTHETLRLAQGRAGLLAGANAVGSVLAGLGAATIGLTVARAVH